MDYRRLVRSLIVRIRELEQEVEDLGEEAGRTRITPNNDITSFAARLSTNRTKLRARLMRQVRHLRR